MSIDFYSPPKAILASGTKEGVELGGDKSILSVDGSHNLFNEGSIFTEMSWGLFYKEAGLEDQIDSFQTTEFKSVRDDQEALTKTVVNCIEKIIRDKRIFYGIADFEVDAFLNQNCVIPGLKLDSKIINKLMEAHKKNRDWNLFPTLTHGTAGFKKIKLEFQGSHKKNLRIFGSNLEDISDRLRLAKGFSTGIVCTSRGAANLYIMNDNISFKDDEISDFYIDEENIAIIEMGIQRELLFPISWFRIDMGIKSLETLELWNEIKDKPQLKLELEKYDNYVSELVYKKYKIIASGEEIGTDLEEDFYNMTAAERKKALKDMSEAIKTLTQKYKE